jgi:hypothetical protein
MNLCGAQWLAYVLLCRRFAAAFAGDRARLGLDVDRYSFIASRKEAIWSASGRRGAIADDEPR